MRVLIASTFLLTVAVLAGIFLIPPRIDPAFLERRLLTTLETAGIDNVEVGGNSTLSILPRPTVSFRNVMVEPSESSVSAEIARIDLILDLEQLARFKIRSQTARIVRPEIDWAGGYSTESLTRPLLANLTYAEIVDGVLSIKGDGAGEPVRLTGIDLNAEKSVAGWQLRGSGVVEENEVTYGLTFGSGSPGSVVPVSVSFGLGSGLALSAIGTTADDLGSFSLETGFQSDRETLDVARRLIGTVTGEPLPSGIDQVSAEGEIEWDGRLLTLQDLNAELNGGEIRGDLSLSFGEDPTVDADFRIADLVLNDGWVDWATTSYWPQTIARTGTLEISGSNVAWRGRTARQFAIDAAIDEPGNIAVEGLRLTTDNASTLEFFGRLEGMDSSPRIEGDLQASGPDLLRVVRDLGLDTGFLDTGFLDNEIGRHSFDLTSQLAIEGRRFAFQEIQGRVDNSDIEGSLAIVDEARPKIAISARIDRLSLDDYWDGDDTLPDGFLASMRERAQSFDAAADIAIETVAVGNIRARDFVLQSTLENGRITLSELSARNIAASAGMIVGSADLGRGEFDIAIDGTTTDPARLLRQLGINAPPTLTNLAPVQLGGTARSSDNENEFELEMTGQGSRLMLAGNTDAWTIESDHEIRVTAQFENIQEAVRSVLLNDAAEIFPASDAEISLLSTSEAQAQTVALEFRHPGTTIAGEFEISHDAVPADLVGALAADRLDLATIARIREIITGETGLVPELRTLEFGSWPHQPFQGLPDWPLTASLRVAVDEILDDAGGSIGSSGATVDYRPDRIFIKDLEIPAAGGVLEGTVEVALSAERTSLALGIELRDGDLRRMIGQDDLIRDDEINVDLELAALGIGPSVAAIVHNLRGQGNFALGDLDMDFEVARGVATASSSEDLSFDLYAWILDGEIERSDGSVIRVFGAPEDLALEEIQSAVELPSPNRTDLPSFPGEPGNRTLPPSADQAPQPLP